MSDHLSGSTHFRVSNFLGRYSDEDIDYGDLDARVSALVDGAPETLDTLRELATLVVSLQTQLQAAENRIYALETGAGVALDFLVLE